MPWLILILSLPTENATARMRAWRALKACGAAVLRDGVYLLPSKGQNDQVLLSISSDVGEGGGTAYMALAEFPHEAAGGLERLFDRSQSYGELMQSVEALRQDLAPDTALETLKQLRKIRKSYAQVVQTDFFPGEAQRQVDAALLELEEAGNRILSPDEPRSTTRAIPRLPLDDYRGRLWATRARPWIDRLASAWLIRRYIDSDARILWLASPALCPKEALGFDFDGAAFSHVGAKVTFETLLASFGLSNRGLDRLGAIVHYLDAGGVQPPEAAGVEQVLAGLRSTVTNDDELLTLASSVFDGLIASFEKDNGS